MNWRTVFVGGIVVPAILASILGWMLRTEFARIEQGQMRLERQIADLAHGCAGIPAR